MQNIDTLVSARWVVPIEPETTVHENFSVVLDQGKIVDVLPTVDAAERYKARDSVDLPHHALIPGFVNSHTHAAMSLFRGLADDRPLMEWLQKHIWPAEQKWVSAEFVRDGTELAVAEMIKSGTTCFNDMYFFPEESARVAQEAGIRACIGLIIIDFPSTWAQSAEEYLHKGLNLHDKLRNHDLITTAFAPHAPYTVSDAPLSKIRTLADELDVPIHMHVHETSHEVDEAVARFGVRPLERLANLGLLTPRLLAVHMTHLLPGEIDVLRERNINVIHCPESNMKLASGFCPVAQLIGKSINVALGTDGAASNNDLDMLAELRMAALLAKGVARDATAVPAHAALRMATLNGAKALGLDDRIGSIAQGKHADIVAIDLSTVTSQPVYDPISQIVYSAARDQVSDVWVNGKRLLKDRQLTTLDEASILDKAGRWRDKIIG